MKDHAFHLTSSDIHHGSFMNVLQYLSIDRANGCVSIGFGDGIPRARLNLVDGRVCTAEFGSIAGKKVLCVLFCQEAAVFDITFEKNDHFESTDKNTSIEVDDLTKTILETSRNVDTCRARPKIYGLLPVSTPDCEAPQPLLKVLHDFNIVNGMFNAKPINSAGVPLAECALLKEALTDQTISYADQLVCLQAVAQLFIPMSPLSDKEEASLRKALSAHLPHKRATQITLNSFWAFADHLEAVAQVRSNEVFLEVRNKVFELGEKLTGHDYSLIAKIRLQKQMERKREADWSQPPEKPKDDSSIFQVQFDTGTFIKLRQSGGYQIGEENPEDRK